MKKNIQKKKGKPQPVQIKSKIPVKDYSAWLIGLCLLLTLIAYIPAFKAEFVNWDDDDYVVNNLLVRDFKHTEKLITTPVQGNYHPLTMLSLAMNYSMSGPKPWAYHLFNVIFHLVNVVLVYVLVSRMTSRNNFISFTVAVLFGIHPMHVESVAWVSERKDVLYTLFFLLGLISYLRYVDKKSRAAYFYSLLWFILSLASKPAAIVFPGILFTFDFLRRRKLELKLFTEKIPFAIFSAVGLFLSLTGQKVAGATDVENFYNLTNRIFFAFYGYMMYLFKLVLPVKLSAFYSMPPINEALPTLYYISPVFFLASAFICYRTWKKYPQVTFAFAFFLINLLLVLQLKVIGSAIISDRYTYVPYIGLFFLIGWLLEKYFRQKISGAYGVVIGLALVLTFVAHVQAKTWTSSVALWENAIKNAPSDRAYVHRASFYRKEGKPEKALELYNAALQLNKISHAAYCNRANLYFDWNMDSLAMEGYNKALSLKPDYVAALDNRGALYARRGKFDSALADLNKAIEVKPKYKTAYSNRALVYFELQQYDSGLADLNRYLKIDPMAHSVYNLKGICYQQIKKYELSIEALNTAIRLNPLPLYYLNRSYAWNSLGRLDEAKSDAIVAKDNGQQLPAEYAKKLGI